MSKRRPTKDVKRLTDPRALRALAHPIRLELVGLLRRRGPLTATKAAELIGENSGSTSFHLRQLAKYGLVEEAGGGAGRERPWRATAMFTGWPEVADTPELAAASGLLRGVIAERYFEQLIRWLERRDTEPEGWQEAAHFGDTLLWLTEDELRELGREEQALMNRYLDRQTNPELRPPGTRLVSYLHLAFPAEPSDTEGPDGGRRG
jgi:DNA-binding transcriptional ArsR family regulator